MVPKIEAMASPIGLSLMANTQPANVIKSVLTIKSALRPKLSARAVIRIVITAPPASAAVKIQPIAARLSPTESR